MKKYFAAFVAMIMMLMTAASAETVFVSNEGGSLNLRQGPGKEHESVGFVQHGDVIEVVKRGGDWSLVQTEDGTSGYIKTLYIEGISDIYASDTDYEGYGYTVYVAKATSFRAGAAITAAVFGTLELDTELYVLGSNHFYYLVETQDGERGFVDQEHVSRRAGARFVKVTDAFADVYEEADSSSERVWMQLPVHGFVDVLIHGEEWSKIQKDGQTGWIRTRYLKF